MDEFSADPSSASAAPKQPTLREWQALEHVAGPWEAQLGAALALDIGLK